MTGTGCVRISGLLAVAPLSHLALMNFARIVLTDRAVFKWTLGLIRFSIRRSDLLCHRPRGAFAIVGRVVT